MKTELDFIRALNGATSMAENNLTRLLYTLLRYLQIYSAAANLMRVVLFLYSFVCFALSYSRISVQLFLFQ